MCQDGAGAAAHQNGVWLEMGRESQGQRSPELDMGRPNNADTEFYNKGPSSCASKYCKGAVPPTAHCISLQPQSHVFV